ncbi:signal peptidase I [Amycolatopsis sp. NBC_01286]|uniref:signal peptidase I n=1 Tax=Amycolatopsis sp. NBC_01286 TaxID=2903560 RepID=UPI002E1438A4|nr:signal peptidase I [Amycolatopsis sp. NBC_01286]
MTEPAFPPAPPAPPKRSGVSKVLLLMIVVAVLGVAAGVYGVGRIMVGYEAYKIPDPHMSPTLVPGDQLVVRRATDTEVHRGDLVAIDAGSFAQPSHEGVSVFRVVGIAGDTVACCTDRHLSINGKPITEPYLNPGDDTLFGFSAKVPDGAIFVEGDNRGNSDDSRFSGSVRLSGVIGFVVATGTVITPRPLAPVTAFTDAGLPGTPYSDSTLPTLRWWIAGGVVLFFAGLIGVIVSAVRSAGRRRRAAAAPPVH